MNKSVIFATSCYRHHHDLLFASFAQKMLKKSAHTLLVLFVFLLVGCTNISHKQAVSGHALLNPETPASNASPARKIVIFFDGTHNDEASDTNVKKLHSLVTLQDRPEILTLYIEGVGTSSDVPGMASGAGINARVRLAYEFILRHYRGEEYGDKIYLVGFSRGAFSARILTSLLYRAGVPKKLQNKTYTEIAETVHRAVTGTFDYTRSAKGRSTEEIVEAMKSAGLVPTGPVNVEALALWDTVAALGLPDWGERIAHKIKIRPHVPDIDEPFERYGDTLCNVVNAYHAMSIDDDREWIFTPLALTRRHLFEGCQDKLSTIRLREVWFSGAHSDVGGGYADTQLSGVSLNWMIEQIRDTGLVPRGARVRQDVHGTSHDPEAGEWSPLYKRMNRNLVRYVQEDNSLTRNLLCVHDSVFQRRRMAPPKEHENQQLVLLRDSNVLWLENDPEPSGFDGRLREVRVVGGGFESKLRVLKAEHHDCQRMVLK